MSVVNTNNLRKAYDLTHKMTQEVPPFNLSVSRKKASLPSGLGVGAKEEEKKEMAAKYKERVSHMDFLPNSVLKSPLNSVFS